MSEVIVATKDNQSVKLTEEVVLFEEDDRANFDDENERVRFFLVNKDDKTVFCDYIDKYTSEEIESIKIKIDNGSFVFVKHPEFKIELYEKGKIIKTCEWVEAFEFNKANNYKYAMVMSDLTEGW